MLKKKKKNFCTSQKCREKKALNGEGKRQPDQPQGEGLSQWASWHPKD